MDECHVCGQESVGNGLIEGAKVSLCNSCMGYAKNQFYYNQPMQTRRKPAGSTPYDTRVNRPPSAQQNLELREDYNTAIKNAREKHGWTREELAKKLLIKESDVIAFEEKRLKPTPEVEKKLEYALGLRLYETSEPDLNALAMQNTTRSGQAPSLADVVEIKKKK